MSAQNYNKLKKEWYKKLKDSGFNDIEKSTGQIGRTKPNVTNRNSDQISAIQEYYAMARSFLIDHNFVSEFEKIVWEYHSEGLSLRKISETLEKNKISTLQRDAIHAIVKRLEKLMKSKYLIP